MNSKTSKIMLIAGMHIAVIGGLLLFESCKPTHKTQTQTVTPPPGAPPAAVVPTEVAPPPVAPVTPIATAPAIESKPMPLSAPAAKSPSSYTVVKGDTLSGIAHKSGTTVTALKQANNLTSDTIRIGQKLSVPSPLESGQKEVAAPKKTVHKKVVKAVTKKEGAEAAAPAGAAGGQYAVEKGDSPAVIAKKLGVKTKDLLDANPGLDPKKLQIGQKLNVPGGAAPAAGGTPAGGIPMPAAGGAPPPAPTVPSPSLPEPPPAAPSIPAPPPSAPSTPAPGSQM